MLLLNLFRPSYSGVHSWVSYLLLLAFWLSVIISGVRFALRHGDQFVGWPHLVALPNYDELDAKGGIMEKGGMEPPEMGTPPESLEK